MKHLLSILLICSIAFTQELTVEGDLNVTGNIQSADSLNQRIIDLELIILQLQTQIALLESQMIFLGQDLNNADCFGIVGGGAVLDECGVCDNDSSNDCLQDCFGEWGGIAEYDICGDCGGDATSEDDCSNYALEFTDAEYYIDIGLPSGMSPTGSHTIMFKLENYTSPNSEGYLIGADVGGSFTANNSLHYMFRSSNDSACPNGACMSMDFYSNTLYADSYTSSALTHWALVYNADGNKERYIYRDGVLVAQGCDGNVDCNYSGNFELILGGTSTAGGVITNYNGVIDDFSVWSKPLSAEEVFNYYLSDPFGNEDALEVLYNFNEGSGNIINDFANQNHGTVIGADPVWVERD